MEGEVADNKDNVGSDSSWSDKMMSSSCHSLFSKSQYGQVVFHDLYEIYPTDCDITFRYTVAESVSPQIGDKICLFKLGWSSPNDFLTCHLVSHDTNSKIVTLQVQDLPKDENNLFQICYITSGNVTAGASLPFRFKKPNESELIATEDPNDPDLLVFKSQFSRIQENLSKVQSEKETMEREIDLLKVRLEQALRELKVYETREEMGTYYDKDLCGETFDDIYPSEKNEHGCEPVNLPRLSLHSNEAGSSNDIQKEKMLQQIFELKNMVKVLEATLESREQDLSHTNNVLLRSYVKDKENLLQEKEILERKLVEISKKHNESVAERCLLKEELNASRALFEALFDEIQQAHPRTPTSQEVVTNLHKNLSQSQVELNRISSEYNEFRSSSLAVIEALESQLTAVEISSDGLVPHDKFRAVLQKKADVSDSLIQTRFEKEQLEKSFAELEKENEALRARLNIMDMELRAVKAKNNKLLLKNEIAGQANDFDRSGKLDICISEMGELNSMLFSGISKLEQVAESVIGQNALQVQLDDEKKENAELKEKVAYLMSFKEQFTGSTDLSSPPLSTVSSNEIESLQMELSTFKQLNAIYKKKVETLTKEKAGLESQLVQLRKEMIGRVTIPTLRVKDL